MMRVALFQHRKIVSTVGALVLLFTLSMVMPVSAQELFGAPGAPLSYETRAVIERITQDETQDGARRVVFEATDREGNAWTVDSAQSYVEGVRYRIAEGRTVILQVVELPDGERTAFLVDVVRVSSLAWIAVLFTLVVVLVGWWRGALALAGLGLTVVVLLVWIVPRILSGADPLLSVVLGSAVILCVNMFLTHGLRRATLVAFGSTLLGLALTVLFSKLFVVWSNLSGLGTEEAAFVQILGGQIQPVGLFLAGMVLGAVGVLDDVAVTQVETVFELRDTDKRLRRGALFGKAMRVGRHHIASVVNTLVLAYAGVALPLLLLFFINADFELWRLVNEELIAEEIVRTLAGTLGLVLLMPIATALAVWAPVNGVRSSPVTFGEMTK